MTELTMSMFKNKDDLYEAKYRDRVLPCPFCGQPPVILGSGEDSRGLMIHCISDDCPSPSTSYYEHESTLRVWNRRGEAK